MRTRMWVMVAGMMCVGSVAWAQGVQVTSSAKTLVGSSQELSVRPAVPMQRSAQWTRITPAYPNRDTFHAALSAHGGVSVHNEAGVGWYRYPANSSGWTGPYASIELDLNKDTYTVQCLTAAVDSDGGSSTQAPKLALGRYQNGVKVQDIQFTSGSPRLKDGVRFTEFYGVFKSPVSARGALRISRVNGSAAQNATNISLFMCSITRWVPVSQGDKA